MGGRDQELRRANDRIGDASSRGAPPSVGITAARLLPWREHIRRKPKEPIELACVFAAPFSNLAVPSRLMETAKSCCFEKLGIIGSNQRAVRRDREADHCLTEIAQPCRCSVVARMMSCAVRGSPPGC